MKRCWIHIGMHKTGTVSLQRTLESVENPLGWEYLKVGNFINQSQPFFSMFAPDPNKYHWLVKKGLSRVKAIELGKRRKASIKKKILASRSEQFIISGEGISLLDKQGVVNLHEFFAPLFDDIRIVAYIRAPIGFRVSMFQQRVKNGRSKFNIADSPLSYQKRFGKFDEVFGSERVHLWKFARDRFPGGCVVADFCRRIGVSLPTGTRVIRSNQSLSLEACAILYAYRKFGNGYGVGPTVVKENRGVISALLAMKGEPLKIAYSLAAKAMERDKVTVAWMEARLGESLVENIEPTQEGISSEIDLLTITPSACRRFVAEFEKLHRLKVSERYLPSMEDPVDPQAVADLVGHCRRLYRESLVAAAKDFLLTSEKLKTQPQRQKNQDKIPFNSVSADVLRLQIDDLIIRSTRLNPDILAKMSKKRAQMLIKNVFKDIVERLATMQHDEVVNVSGLGKFRVNAERVLLDGAQTHKDVFQYASQAMVKASKQRFLEHQSRLKKEPLLAAIDARNWVLAREIGESLLPAKVDSLETHLNLCVVHQMLGDFVASAEQLEYCQKAYAPELGRDYPFEHKKVTIFDNGETRIEFYKKLKRTDKVIITFDSQGEEYQGHNPPFAYDLLKKLDVDIIAVRFWRERSFMQDLSIQDFTDAVKPMIGCYVRKITYGTSIGGYGALYFGTALGCDVLSMAPRNSNHPKYGGSKTPKRLKFHHNFELTVTDNPFITILFDPKERMDRNYVDLGLRPRLSKAKFLEFPYAGHYIPDFLLSTGILKLLVMDAFNRELKPLYTPKNRHQAPFYLTNLGIACLNQGKKKWAVKLFETVADSFPENAKAAEKIKATLKKAKL